MLQCLLEGKHGLIIPHDLHTQVAEVVPDKNLFRCDGNGLFVGIDGIVMFALAKFNEGDGIETFRFKPIIFKIDSNFDGIL